MKKHLFIISFALALFAGTAPAIAASLIERARDTPELRTFVEMVQGTPLEDTLKGADSYTVFAPSDSAFNKLPARTREEILADKSKLTKILAYHVIKGKTLIAEVRPGRVKTLEGSTISLDSDNGLVKVNGASVIQSDLETDNGVIHVIDSVLQPGQ